MLYKHQTPSLVTLTNAGVQRDGKWLVRGVDMKIERGEIVTLIGPNGSGKSTTTKMAIGILRADEGTATRNHDLSISYVPQKLVIDWTMPLSVQRFMSLTNPLSKVQISQALEATGVAHLKEKQVRTLSGGEMQRVLLARAIARKPDLLVLDEPVQGVDFNGEIALYDLIKDIRDQLNCGILLVSHDLHVVMAATDQVICLNGHVCCAGTPSKVSQSAEYNSLFGARIASLESEPTLAIYEHNHDHTHLPDGTVRHADGTITDNCQPTDGHGDNHRHGHHDHSHTSKPVD